MKWNKETLDAAIDHLLPTIKIAKEFGQEFNRVRLMTQIAENYFIISLSEEREVIKDTDLMAYTIISKALKELYADGQFNYGSESFDFNK